MRLIDTNVIVYTVGSIHPLKEAAEGILSDVAAGTLAANVDAEMLQEILHVYSSRGERKKGFRTLEHLLTLFPNPFSIGREEIERARDLMMKYSFLVTRDAIHAAVVQTHDLEGIVTADNVFDRIRGLKRFGLK
ncbi:MAG TPA: type II toxin-antitoxin system VapC family toxin [Candidatus Binatia bacterium]